MKKFAALLCALCCFMACTWVSAETQEEREIIVANNTRMNGMFFTDMWGNNTSDIDARALLHSLPTVAIQREKNYDVNRQVVKDLLVTTDAKGDKTYRFTLEEDLYFSDGTPITAEDYVFSVLLTASPQMREIGGHNRTWEHLVGCRNFRGGVSNTFTGVRLLGLHSFSLTIDAVYLPYFDEPMLASVTPYPMHVLAPGCTLKDDGQGAYLSSEFTAELIAKTILDKNTGYLFRPSVVSGPYVLKEYDAASATASFELNPYFKGNYQGQKPTIRRLRLVEGKNDTVLQKLKAGEVDIINKMTLGSTINGAKKMAGKKFGIKAYDRSGLAYLSFSGEEGDISSLNLRKAIAHAVNRESVIKKALANYGKPVYSLYGKGQWMAMGKDAKLKKELNAYTYDLKKAEKFLAEDGWTLDENGKEMKVAKGKQRYRMEKGALVPLTLRMAISPNNAIADVVVEMLQKNLGKIGCKLEVDRIAMDELLRRYYRQEERGYDIYFLGTNFRYVFDPYIFYQVEREDQGEMNTSGIKSIEMLRMTELLRKTERGDFKSYEEKWLDFQRYWTEMLPAIPLYSNIYHDAYAADIQNYCPEKYYSWAEAILYATLH